MKILCPFHDESTPSCHVYETHYRCYGCGRSGPLAELGLKGNSRRRIVRNRLTPPEDLDKSLKRISELPTKAIRGFNLPHDDTGYYIVYPPTKTPGVKYYTKRLTNPPRPGDKYRGPTGHKKPLFEVRYESAPGSQYQNLFVVEGQLNAWSFIVDGCVYPPGWQIVSPGSATDLNRPDFVNYYLQYNRICVIVDKDPAGVVSGITLRDTLLFKGKEVVLYAMQKDMNEIYVTEGQEAVSREVNGALRLFGGMPQRQEGMPTPGEGTGESI